MIALFLFIYNFVATCAFVCCDSGKSRKAYALALLLGGLSGLLVERTPGQFIGAALGCYWAYEMNKLAEMHDDYAKM